MIEMVGSVTFTSLTLEKQSNQQHSGHACLQVCLLESGGESTYEIMVPSRNL